MDLQTTVISAGRCTKAARMGLLLSSTYFETILSVLLIMGGRKPERRPTFAKSKKDRRSMEQPHSFFGAPESRFGRTR
ncbi:hypothetical protein BS17DRAFT_776257 [Gyrodon lividus]|nr:hypothetical protein BS17DRAFT_776257 [Gyrodon lividus]